VKIMNLTGSSTVYTSNVYLVTGTWNRLEDVNTLVDVGRDLSILELIFEINTGVGKKKVEQVVLTHSHYDHAGLLPGVSEVFSPEVRAGSSSLQGVDVVLKDGDSVKMGDRDFEVIHAPGHSSDSMCFYCQEEGVLFSGDAPVIIRSSAGSYEEGFLRAMEKLCRRDVRKIYFGHGAPMADGCNEALRNSLKNIRAGMAEMEKADGH